MLILDNIVSSDRVSVSLEVSQYGTNRKNIELSGLFCGPYEKELIKDLLYDYERQNRPVLNESEPLVLTFGVSLTQIIDVVRHKNLPYKYDFRAVLSGPLDGHN